MNLETLSAHVLDVIEAFDAATAPFGLYAARDILLEPRPKEVLVKFLTLTQRRPELLDLKPFINKVSNITHWTKQNETEFRFAVPNLGFVDLTLVRTSKIKVRKFGSAYRLDKHEKFEERWAALRMDKRISTVRQEGSGVSMLLFLGFDRAARPFERELAELKPHQNRESHGVAFVSREWEDRFERKFFVRAALWARLSKESE